MSTTETLVASELAVCIATNAQDITGLAGAGDLKITPVVKPDLEPLSAAYGFSLEQAAFFKAQTGINDDEELRAHILRVQEKAYKVFPYGIIRSFRFLRLRIATLPEFESIIKLGKERPDGILLDVGCCFGVDARKAIAEGFPLKNVVTTDLLKEFHDLGHTLFNTTPETYPISFVHGDALDPNILQIVPPFDKPPLTERPDLTTLTSLNPLAGRCAVIYTSSFFHLFSEANQTHLAKALAGLLSPEPGSMICGKHAGNLKMGVFHGEDVGMELDMFLHCPESWTAMWDGVFGKGKVRVNAEIYSEEIKSGPAKHGLQWSVVRL